MEKETHQHVDDGGTLDPEVSRPAENSKFNLATQHDQLKRGLKSRHIQFLALGRFCHSFSLLYFEHTHTHTHRHRNSRRDKSRVDG